MDSIAEVWWLDESEDLRAFVERHFRELKAEIAKYLAALDLMTPVQVMKLARRNRRIALATLLLSALALIVLLVHVVQMGGLAWLLGG